MLRAMYAQQRSRKPFSSWAAVLAAAALALGCASQDGVLRGKVIALADGDTLTVLENGTKHRIRLTGIDAPERRQAYSKRSTEHLASFVFNREVEVHGAKRDRYGRILGKVMATDPGCVGSRCPKIDVNLRQIEGGFAWWYRQYAKEQAPSDRAAYEAAEQRSREAKRGLWEEPTPTAPWEWRRKERRSKGREKAPSEARPSAAATPR